MPFDFGTRTNGVPNVVEASPGTRRRRRQRAPSSYSSSQSSSVFSPLDIPTMSHQLPSSVYQKLAAAASSSSPSLPMRHAASPDSSPSRYRGQQRWGSSSSPSKQSRQHQWYRNFLRPMSVIRILGFLVVARLVYSHFCFVAVSHQRSLWLTTTHHATDRFLEIVLPHSDVSGGTMDVLFIFHTKPPCPSWMKQRRLERMDKTRPKLAASVDDLSVAPTGTFLNESPIINAPTTGVPDWNNLCKQANMNSGSQVLIFNLVSHPVGPAVAKLIAKQCHVKKVIGADPMLPNLRRTRLDFMNMRKELLYHIPGLQMIVTEPGMGLHEKNRPRPLQWLRGVKSTHVLVLDPMDSPVLVDSMGGLSSFELYATQQIRHFWQDLTATMNNIPMRLLHIGNPLLQQVSATMGMASVSLWNTNIPFSFATINLNALSGPGMDTKLYPGGNETVFVDKGLQAVMTGWTRPKQLFSVALDPSPVTREESLEMSIWDDYTAHPFGLTAPSSNETAILATRRRLEALGSTPVRLPCASQCQSTSSVRTCTASSWDHAIGPSVTATRGCQHALIMANFSLHVSDAPLHAMDPGMCRVFYISRKSPLAKKSKTTANGEASSHGWKLVWLDMTEKSYSPNDAAFLRIDPSRLMSSSVTKVMHVNTMAFGNAPDQGLLNILKNIDQPAFREGERRVLEKRRGTELKHWKALPAEKARRVVLFMGSHLPENVPAKVTQYRTINGGPLPSKQIDFYNQLGHWTQVILDRPQEEIQATRYLTFPFEWTSRYFLVHDLRSDAARQLRCRWLEEHMTWNSKPSYWETDDLSLAAVLGSMKISNEIGLPMKEMETGWLPFMVDEEENLVEGDEQIFLRLMQPRDD